MLPVAAPPRSCRPRSGRPRGSMGAVPARRRVPHDEGLRAVEAWRSSAALSAADRATAVRFLLEELSARAPGRSVEVRVPPDAVGHCISGPGHTRGTPPNVVETDPRTWLELAAGPLRWDEAVRAGRVRASGQRADLSRWLPLLPPGRRTGPGTPDRPGGEDSGAEDPAG